MTDGSSCRVLRLFLIIFVWLKYQTITFVRLSAAAAAVNIGKFKLKIWKRKIVKKSTIF